MVLVGIAFFLLWLLVEVFLVELVKAILVTAIVFIIAGILVGERPWERRP